MTSTKTKNLFPNRLKSALELRQMKAIELSNLTGITRGALSSYLSGRWAPKQNNIYKIANALNVEESWLMGYDTPINKDSSYNKNTNEYQYIPYAVSAGEPTEIDGINFYNKLSVPDLLMGKYAGNKNIVLMPVNGESMNNVIANGSIIAVLTKTPLECIHDNDIVVIRHNGDYTVKRFYNDVLHQEYVFKPDSTDLAFRDIVFNYDNTEDLELIGKVVMYSVML